MFHAFGQAASEAGSAIMMLIWGHESGMDDETYPAKDGFLSPSSEDSRVEVLSLLRAVVAV